MSVGKKVMLALYAVLVALAVTQGGTPAGDWSLRLLGILALAHLFEVIFFFKLAKAAGGSIAGHLLSIFLFGVLHVGELKAAQGKS